MKASSLFWLLGISAAVIGTLVAGLSGWKVDFANAAWGAIGSALVLAVLGALVKKSLDEELAEKKATIDKDLAELQARLQERTLTTVESKKSDILIQLEMQRHELQKLVEKSKAATSIQFRELPRIYLKLRKTEAACNRLFGMFLQPNFDSFSESQLREYLVAAYRGIPESEIGSICEMFSSKAGGGAKAIQTRMHQLDISQAVGLAQNALAYLSRNELFIPRHLYRLADQAAMDLYGAATISRHKNPESFRSGRAQFTNAGKLLGEFRNEALELLGIQEIEARNPATDQPPDSEAGGKASSG